MYIHDMSCYIAYHYYLYNHWTTVQLLITTISVVFVHSVAINWPLAVLLRICGLCVCLEIHY